MFTNLIYLEISNAVCLVSDLLLLLSDFGPWVIIFMNMGVIFTVLYFPLILGGEFPSFAIFCILIFCKLHS